MNHRHRPLRAVRLAAVCLVIQGLLLATHAETDTAGETRAAGTASIVSITRTTVYLDAGREDGLAEGDRLEIVRGDAVVAVVTVEFLSSHRAAASLEGIQAELQPDDAVRFTPRLDEPRDSPGAVDQATRNQRSGPGALRRAGIRGRVGLRYLSIKDNTNNGVSFSQPGLDLRLDGSSIGGSGVDVAIDVRTRRVYTQLADGSSSMDGLTRVYRAAVGWHDPELGLTVAAGRQYSPTLSAVSIFDGLLLDLARPRWGIGAFSGSQPDLIDFGYSGAIREHGLYVGTHSAPGSRRNWSIVFGGVGSYTEGTVNREFLFMQTRYASPRFTLYAIQEVDYNRAWRTEFEDSTVSPTGTFVNVQLRAARQWTLWAGYDNRRRVRLYRDRITPETEFDDDNRLGARVGWTWAGNHARVGMDGRSNSGGSGGESSSYSINLGGTRFTAQNLGFGTRSTYYVGPRSEGWLHAVQIGSNLGNRLHLELGGGLRDELLFDALSTPTQQQITWYGIDLDVRLGRRWYLLLSAERNQGDLDDNYQFYNSLTFRF